MQCMPSSSFVSFPAPSPPGDWHKIGSFRRRGSGLGRARLATTTDFLTEMHFDQNLAVLILSALTAAEVSMSSSLTVPSASQASDGVITRQGFLMLGQSISTVSPGAGLGSSRTACSSRLGISAD